jgi:hypothetical protein
MLIGRRAEDRLLAGGQLALPRSIGSPPAGAPESRARRRLTVAGATLTGGSLLGGIALIVLAVVLLAGGGSTAAAAVVLLTGLALVGTHWGWVHVAVLTADRLEHRHELADAGARERWLAAIEPYPRFEVATEALPGGAIEIVVVAFRPVPAGAEGFTFEREIQSRERHGAEEPAATVAERAELLRRRAAADTEQARRRYAAALQAREAERLRLQDEQEGERVRQVEAQALSEAINENLRRPPLADE